MARYTVSIPPPSAKRMAAFGKLVISLHHGYEGDKLITYDINPSIVKRELPENAKTFEFEVPDQYEWIYSSSIIDGWYFDVACEYANSTGSRKETKQLVPEKIT